MSPANYCTQKTDSLKLVREGTTQEQRLSPALEPSYAPLDERTIAHGMVFAQAYAAFLKYFDSSDTAVDDWTPFFSKNASALLSAAAVQDVDHYRSTVKEYLDFLKDDGNKADEQGLKDKLGQVFGCVATLAKQLDVLKEGLPTDIPLRGMLQNLIQNQLARSFNRLLLYYRDGTAPGIPSVPALPYLNDAISSLEIMGLQATSFLDIRDQGLSKDWIPEGSGASWAEYLTAVDDLSKYPETKIYGSGDTLCKHVNYIATHNLFTSILDQFLKTYARVVIAAQQTLADRLEKCDSHEPHYALFLAFLRLFEYARAEVNTLTKRHLDFYYRDILRLKEKSAEPGRAHLLIELAKQADSREIEAGRLFKAGKDKLGIEAFFTADRNVVPNKAKVAALKTLYRHGSEQVAPAPTEKNQGRLYASPVADSDDGIGAKLTSEDKSWHPFYNKIYKDGALAEIRMPKAEIGFAVASHYLLMGEGERLILAEINVSGYSGEVRKDFKNKITCLLTSEQEWIEKTPYCFFADSKDTMYLAIVVKGGDPSITPYAAKTHGYAFDTDLPMLMVKLKHEATDEYSYGMFQDIVVNSIKLSVLAFHVKALAVSNDFGPVDTSKPFQPYGPSPVKGNALIIGSKEVFQKKLAYAALGATWLIPPAPYPAGTAANVGITIDFLKEGNWSASTNPAIKVGETSFPFTNDLDASVVDEPDFTSKEFFNTVSRHGFARLRLNSDFGQNAYQTALLKYVRKEASIDPGKPPAGPSMSELWMNYYASQSIPLDPASADAFKERKARFFHTAPFGQDEQHPFLNSLKKVFLLPQFGFQRDGVAARSEAELYVGISDLKPPQNLSLLFQVADGTADPLSEKPKSHINWSYLRGNEWTPFSKSDVEDGTAGLINSGITTFAVPRDASSANTLLPAGMHWIRAAVESKSGSVCRMRMVAAQALRATFTDKGNDPAFPAEVLQADTISKLDQPDSAIKKIAQPFATFGGRGRETSASFYTRVSERLRHKDRAIALWDYERLVLEKFPQIYRVKCLDHTQHDPNESGAGIYNELAPGHVTVIAIPDLQVQNLRDPLRPYTSLGLLKDIEGFLSKRFSCFVKVHVKNPDFEEVMAQCNVRLRAGSDETLCLGKMRESITRFLSPWAFSGGGSPSFGGKIYKSVLINFMEDLPYVDYVTDVKLFHTFLDADGNQQKAEQDEVEGSKAVSILVSARTHLITAINPAEAEVSGEKCACTA